MSTKIKQIIYNDKKIYIFEYLSELLKTLQNIEHSIASLS